MCEYEFLTMVMMTISKHWGILYKVFCMKARNIFEKEKITPRCIYAAVNFITSEQTERWAQEVQRDYKEVEQKYRTGSFQYPDYNAPKFLTFCQL